jgi:polar amino acid transport system substrate-binding protein
MGFSMILSFVKRSLKKSVFLLFLGLSACGGSSSTSYQIAMDPAWYSIESMGREKNLIGFATDLLAEISKDTDTRLSLRSANWNTLFDGLKDGQYQGVLSGMPPYNFNQQTYTFSSVFLETGPVLIVPFSSSIRSLNALSGKEVGIISDSSAVTILEKYPDILIRTYDSIPKMLNDILVSAIDAAVVGILPAEAFCQDLYHGQLKIATKPLNEEGLRLIAMAGVAEPLIKTFDLGLEDLKDNGEYDKLLKKWSLSSTR